ncbi:ribonuclease H-like domain-containing protein, partial [Mycena vitilis]
MTIPDVPALTNPGGTYLREKIEESKTSEAYLDVLLRETLQAKRSPEDRRAAFYGSAYGSDTGGIKAYTDGSCFLNGSPEAYAGAGVYLGPNNKFNASLRVTGDQTNNRGELLAILYCLSNIPADKRLDIYSDSEYSIRSIVYWAPGHAETGWKCANADLLQDIVSWIKFRSAPVHFFYVKAHAGNRHNEAADAAAKLGAS